MKYPWLTPLWQQLTTDIAKDRFAHAHCFVHSEDAAMPLFIERLIAFLLCQQPTNQACGQCKSCLLQQAGTHPDYIKLGQADQNVIGVDEVRALISQLANTANQGGFKVAYIERADRLNRNAANALLKTLEEPAAKTVLVVSAEAPQRLLPTLKSRMRMHPLPSFSVAELQAWLSTQAGQPVTTLTTGNALTEAVLQRFTQAPLQALRLMQGAAAPTQALLDELFKALTIGQSDSASGGWPTLNDKATIPLALAATQQLLVDLVRIAQAQPSVYLHEDAVLEARAYLQRMSSKQAPVHYWYQQLQRVQQIERALAQQSGLNAGLLLSQVWMEWPRV